MHLAHAQSRDLTRHERRRPAPTGRRLLAAALATALLVAPASVAVGVATGAAPAAAAPAAAAVSIPLADDVMTRMTTHVGWSGATAANPDAGDCARYGAAPDAMTTGEIDNTGGSAGAETSAWSDGATAWVSAGETAYSAHGRAGADCSDRLDLSSQSAVGFSPASIASIQTGTAFNLGHMVHRNNPVYTANEWFHGSIDVRLLGLDLSYAWELHETPNRAEPPADPANNDVLEFLDTVGEHSIVGPDGNRYTLVVTGFTAPLDDGTCAATLADPGEALSRFETVERTSTTGCLYGEIQQVRSLTVVKVATTSHAAPGVIPAFGFTTVAGTPGSAWEGGFSLTPGAVGRAGAASVTRDIVVGESLTIAEDPASAPWSFTDLACVDGTGAALPLTSGAQITIDGDLSTTDAAAAPITCTYTNTYDPRGALTIAKTVTPRDGVPAAGYTGGGERVFALDYACELDGDTVAHGVAEATTSTAVTVADLPVGAECAITGETATVQSGDFADDTYTWDGFDVSASSVVISVDAAVTLTADNRFARDEAPAPVTPPAPAKPAPTPSPSPSGSPAGGLAVTGGGPVLPLAIAGAALLAVGVLAALVRRRRTRH